MDINSTLLEINEKLAVCALTIKTGNQSITVYATGLASESQLYPDLAQSKAAALAHAVQKNGLEGLPTTEGFTSKAEKVKMVQPETPPPTDEVQPQTFPEPAKASSHPAPDIPVPVPETLEPEIAPEDQPPESSSISSEEQHKGPGVDDFEPQDDFVTNLDWD